MLAKTPVHLEISLFSVVKSIRAARRLWSHAFTNESLAEFDVPLKKRVETLIEKLAEASKVKNGTSASVDLSLWFSHFSLDFMGDLWYVQLILLLKVHS